LIYLIFQTLNFYKMEKTAMQHLIWYIESIEKLPKIMYYKSIYAKANRLLEVEKKQIIDSFEDSFNSDSYIVSGEEYYNEKFENNE